MEERIDKIWKKLATYGIHSEEELDVAIAKMKPLNIGCMVSPIKKEKARREAIGEGIPSNTKRR